MISRHFREVLLSEIESLHNKVTSAFFSSLHPAEKDLFAFCFWKLYNLKIHIFEFQIRFCSCFLATNYQLLLEMNKTETKTKFNTVNTVAEYFQIFQCFARFWITKPNWKIHRTTENMLLCFRFKFRTWTSNQFLCKIKTIRLRSKVLI